MSYSYFLNVRVILAPPPDPPTRFHFRGFFLISYEFAALVNDGNQVLCIYMTKA